MRTFKGRTMQTYRRRLTPVERYYVSCDNRKSPYATPCVNQMMLEGHGEFNEAAWQRAVELASMKNPGSRLVLKGKLGLSYWRAVDKPCRLRILDDNGWDGMSGANCPFNQTPLPAFTGPTTELVLIKSQPLRLVLRTHHGTMDGRGTQAFLDDIFRALNNEPLKGENSCLTDLELIKQLNDGKTKYGQFYPDDAVPPTGNPDGTELGSRWVRRRITSKHRQLLAKTAINIARLVDRYDQSKPARIQLAVDMRPRVEGVRSTANLTGTILMEVTPDTQPDEWDRAIKDQLSQMKDAELPRFATRVPLTWLGWIPLDLIHKFNGKLVKKRLGSGLYRSNAIISNLGRLSIDRFEGGGFKADSGLFIPPEFDATAFFLTMAGSPSGIDFVLRTPNILATNNRLEEALDFIVDNLEIA